MVKVAPKKSAARKGKEGSFASLHNRGWDDDTYAKSTSEVTPNTATGKSTSGQTAGMGAALRGGSYKSC